MAKYERRLFGDAGPLDSVPVHTKVEESLMFDAANDREWLEKEIGNLFDG